MLTRKSYRLPCKDDRLRYLVSKHFVHKSCILHQFKCGTLRASHSLPTIQQDLEDGPPFEQFLEDREFIICNYRLEVQWTPFGSTPYNGE
jgi:hypothetical protein